MSIRLKGPSGNGPVQGSPNIEFAYRSLVSSNQQKLFDKVLSQVRFNSEDTGKQEINSLQSEITNLQKAASDSQKIDQVRQQSPQQGQESKTQGGSGILNDLTTSALLRLAALSPQRGSNLSGYYREALGSSSVARGGRQDNSEVAAGKSSGDVQECQGQGPGVLSARFESGANGVGTIGYDDRGGTSYGLYQISSRVGTMHSFLEYLQDRAPRLAARLRSAGSSNTGGTGGGMPREWKKIAEEDPEGFGQLQHEFIQQTHYRPALEEISRRTGLDVEKQSATLQEVLWSTAVQHGARGAANIFCKAIDQGELKGRTVAPDKLIDDVYDSRARYAGSLSNGIRDAVWRRFKEEKNIALAMLADEGRRKGASSQALA